MNNKSKLTVALPPEVMRELERYCADTERTFEGVVVDAIEEFLMQATHEGRTAMRTVPGYRAYWAKRGREVPQT